MSDIVKAGLPIPLRAQMATSRSDLFVRAYIYDQSKNPLNSGNPIDLTHVGNGLYMDYSFLMPNVPFVHATYEVALDAGFLEIAPQDGSGTDTFELADSEAQDLIRRDELIAVISDELEVLTLAVDASLDVIAGYECDDEINGLLSDDSILSEVVEESILTGVVKCQE